MRIARHRAPVLVAALLVASTAQAEAIRRIVADRGWDAPAEKQPGRDRRTACSNQNQRGRAGDLRPSETV